MRPLHTLHAPPAAAMAVTAATLAATLLLTASTLASIPLSSPALDAGQPPPPAGRNVRDCTDPIPTRVVEPVVSPLVYAGGTVVARALVSTAGAVRAIEVVRPVAALVDPVTAAVRQWRFSPARCEGEATEAWTTVAVHVMLLRDTVGGARGIEVRD